MKKIVKTFCSILVIGFMCLSLTTCDTLLDILGNGGGNSNGGGVSKFIPNTEQMVFALKEALSTGSNDAGATLSVKGAFNENQERRIPLPPEVDTAFGTLNSLPAIPGTSFTAAYALNFIGGNKAIDDLKASINASAEEASKGVAEAFKDSITSMTFQNALIILKGERGTEATEYLDATTRIPLKAAFKLVLDPVLDKPLILDISANKAWEVTNKYNEFVEKYYNPAVDIYNVASILLPNKVDLKKLDPINTDLADFILEKALTAVFNEMAVVEMKIRDDPLGFVSDVVGALTDTAQKVFDWAKTAIGI